MATQPQYLQALGTTPYGQAVQQPQVPSGQPNIANLITSLDGPALQKLLGAIQQNPQQPVLQQSPTQVPDLAALLGNVVRQQPAPSQGNTPGYPYPQQIQQPQYPYPGYQQPQQAGAPFSQQPTGQPPQQHVQNIMDQLARWKQ